MYTFIESLKLALASLRAHKLRSFLTLLGVIFGVMTVVAVASVIEGANRYVAEKIADMGSNTLTIDKYGIITSFEEFIDANKRNKDLTLGDVDFLRARMTLASHIGAQGYSTAEVKAGNEAMKNITVRGVSAAMVNIDTVQPEFGRYVNEIDEERRRYATMIGLRRVAGQLRRRPRHDVPETLRHAPLPEHRRQGRGERELSGLARSGAAHDARPPPA
jgi:putative ABC transport system permease protein